MKTSSAIILLLVAFSYKLHAAIVKEKTAKDIPLHMHPSPSHVEENFRVKRRDAKFHADGYESTSQFWKAEAQKKLRLQLDKKANHNVAKNLILFLGDGMSFSTITAARIYFGQKLGFTGEESGLSFEEFPAIGLSKAS